MKEYAELKRKGLQVVNVLGVPHKDQVEEDSVHEAEESVVEDAQESIQDGETSVQPPAIEENENQSDKAEDDVVQENAAVEQSQLDPIDDQEGIDQDNQNEESSAHEE